MTPDPTPRRSAALAAESSRSADPADPGATTSPARPAVPFTVSAISAASSLSMATAPAQAPLGSAPNPGPQATRQQPAAAAVDAGMDAPAPAPAPAARSRRLHVCHETSYAYDAPVELAHHLAHLRPRDTPTQTVSHWGLNIEPLPDQGAPLADGDGELRLGAPDAAPDAALRSSRDGWGNWRCSFSHSRVHRTLTVVSTFTVDLHPAAPLTPAASPPWEQVAERLRYRPGRIDEAEREAVEFALASAYAPRDAALRAFAAPLFPPGRPLLEGALALMHEIYEGFEYRPLATSVATRAPAALEMRKGVCQDFAHVMIGALRSLGLAARYVSGYLLTHPPAGQPRLVGADASHAWAAVWCPLHGWVALDPTNDVLVGQDHVTLAWGRDYGDVAPLRGVIRGSGRAVPQVAVTVQPEEPHECEPMTVAAALVDDATAAAAMDAGDELDPFTGTEPSCDPNDE